MREGNIAAASSGSASQVRPALPEVPARQSDPVLLIHRRRRHIKQPALEEADNLPEFVEAEGLYDEEIDPN
jgi:hypothetical protein